MNRPITTKTHIGVALLCAVLASHAAEKISPLGSDNAIYLNEIIVTAEKREQPLQDVPVAISVLDETQLTLQGISSLGDLVGGAVPSLRVNPFGNAPSTLVMTIRGNGPVDTGQTTRDNSVALYLDDIYLDHSQGLNMELVDLERIEVLRGPQGSLFGRNATGGAISLVSKRPSGEFDVKQTFTVGRYDQRTSVTHVDFPEWSGVKAKLSYLHNQRDGWVENTAPGEADFNAYEKRGGRVSIDWQAADNFILSYSYNRGYTEMTQNYMQLYRDFIGVFGDEPHREMTTRAPVIPLDPTENRQQLHTLKADWTLSDKLRFVSLSSYREMDDRTTNNYAGAAYFNGVMEEGEVEQEQISQEFRLLGTQDRLTWVTGFYGFKGAVDEVSRHLFTLDIFGDPSLTGVPLTPIIPPTNYDAFSGTFAPQNTITVDIHSMALYGQATWTPPVLQDKLDITLGLRHSREEKAGERVEGGYTRVDLDTRSTDPTITLNYHWSENLSTYLKWGTAYRSGGVNIRSTDLIPFTEEEVETVELGLKSEWWQQRARFNAAVFNTAYEDTFIDVFDPANIVISNTINAANTVKIDGLEFDFTLQPITSLTLGLSYTYLDGDMPPQPNPFAGGALESFDLTQTPRHAGAMSLDYQLPTARLGTFMAHLDIVSSSQYHHWPTGGTAHPDGYTLINGRLVLANIPLGGGQQGLSLAFWGKNLTDEEYAIFSFNFEGVSTLHAFGEPRTAGIDITYTF